MWCMHSKCNAVSGRGNMHVRARGFGASPSSLQGAAAGKVHAHLHSNKEERPEKLTAPSSRSMAYLLDLIPRPLSARSSSTPMACSHQEHYRGLSTRLSIRNMLQCTFRNRTVLSASHCANACQHSWVLCLANQARQTHKGLIVLSHNRQSAVSRV